MTILTLVGVLLFPVGVVMLLWDHEMGLWGDEASPDPGAGTYGPTPIRGYLSSLWFLLQAGSLVGLMIAVGVGASGLIATVIPGDTAGAAAEPSVVLQRAAFVVVGGPALFALARWFRRRGGPSGEAYSPVWACYLYVATLACLISGGEHAVALALGVLGVEGLTSGSVAGLWVWGAMWFIHYRLAARQGHAGHRRLGVLAGSLAGLALLTFGVYWGLRHSLGGWLDEAAGGTAWQSGSGDELLRGLVSVVVGGGIWARYWLSEGLRLGRDAVWRGYVVLVGGLVSLLIALAAVGALAASVLDWLLGGGSGPAAVHFAEAPRWLALLVVSAAAWAYHRAVVRAAPVAARGPVDRAHDYIAAGAGLLAAVIGLVMAIVAVIRVVTSAGIGFAGERSTLANAVALLVVGVPVWWHYWSKVRADRAVEVETTVRYVTLLGSGVRDLADAVRRRTGVKLWLFERPDLDVGFSADEVVAAIESAEHEQLLIVARRAGPEVIPWSAGADHVFVEAGTSPAPMGVILLGSGGRDLA